MIKISRSISSPVNLERIKGIIVRRFGNKNNTEHLERSYQRERFMRRRFFNYQRWVVQNYPNESDITAQRKEINNYKFKPLISVIIPIYKTDPNLLRECFDSVVKQSYENWEICAVDDHSESLEIKKIAQEYKKKYGPKFQYKYQEVNGHISLTSNAAVEISKGDFILLLDHDDVLWPNAMYEAVKLLNNHPNIDFIYTDEDMLEDACVHDHPYTKPAFDELMLRSCNYITHMVLLKREVFNKVGGFRVGVEGAQDWDLFLRATRKTKKIAHISTITYSWRLIETSTAMGGFDAKPYAYEAQRKSVIDNYKALNIPVDEAVLHKYFVGWMPKFNNLDITVQIVIRSSSIEQTYALMKQVEDTKGEVSVCYTIEGVSRGALGRRDRGFMGKLDITYVSELRPSDITEQYVVLLKGFVDMHAQLGWLNSALGLMEYSAIKGVAFSILTSQHIVQNAGYASETKRGMVELLHGYYEGLDKRLDTQLLSMRSTQAINTRACLTTKENAKIIAARDKNYDNQVLVLKDAMFSPFAKCFVPADHNTVTPYGVAKGQINFGLHLPKESKFWFKDYINDSNDSE